MYVSFPLQIQTLCSEHAMVEMFIYGSRLNGKTKSMYVCEAFLWWIIYNIQQKCDEQSNHKPPSLKNT